MDQNTRILLRVLDKQVKLRRQREREAMARRDEAIHRRIRYAAYKAAAEGDLADLPWAGE